VSTVAVVRGSRRRSTKLACAALLGLGASLVGCGDDASLLARSCAGEAVPNCRAYEYSRVTEAQLLPEGLEIGDVGADAMFHVRLETCGASSPAPHEVIVQLLATRGSAATDGGSSLMVFMLGSLRDDGTAGDAMAGDGVIDHTVPNPLISAIPPSSDVVLRFEPRAGPSCVGEGVEVAYRTGMRAGLDAGL